MKKSIKRITTMIMASLVATSLVGCNIIQRTEESKGKTVLAKVNDVKITRADVDAELYYTLNYYKSNYGEDFETNEDLIQTIKDERTSVINYIINEEVVLSKQDELKVKYPEDELNKDVKEQINSFKEYYGDDDTYKEFLKAYGFTEKTFKEYWRRKLLVNKIAEAMVADVTVSEEEIENYYNEHIDEYKINPGADVTHIVFTDKETGESDAKAARELYLQGKTLEEISEMDEFKNKCKLENLGHQDFENNTTLVSEFVEGFKNLPEGQISEPVKTSYGYHLIINSNVNTEERTQTLDEVRDSISEVLLNEKKNEVYNEKLEEYKKSMNIKIYEDRY